jgi:hypothetical protein
MLTYFDKFSFLGLLFLQVVISYLSSILCQNVKLLDPHCLYYVANSTLTHSQLHIAKSSTTCCQIVNSTLQVVHYQLAKLIFFFRLPPFFTLSLWKMNVLLDTLNSFLKCPNKILWDFFSTHLPSVPTSNS